MDDGTLYVSAWTVTPNTATDYGHRLRLFYEVHRIAGNMPTLLVSDKDPTYHKEQKQKYRECNALWKKIVTYNSATK